MAPAIPLGASERAALESEWSNHPGMRHMGARADFSDPETVRVVIDPVQPFHRGGLGTDAVNGAVIAGLFDVVIGVVGQFHTKGRLAGTAQLSMHFLRPLRGNRVVAKGRLVRAGTNLVFAAAEALDENGIVCATAEGIVGVSGGGVEEAGRYPL